MPGVLVAGVLVGFPPAFTSHGSRLFTPCGRSALCYSVKTACHIGTLPAHKGQVTAVCAGHPRSEAADPVATGSSEGEVIVWDSKSYACLGSISFLGPILALRWPAANTLLLVLGRHGQQASVERVHLDDVAAPRHVGTLPVNAEEAGPFDATSDTVALADGVSLNVWREGWLSKRKCAHPHCITAALIEADKRFLVTGDVRGVVWTWWGVLDDDEGSPKTPARWHWHWRPVRALAQSGPVILSGGDEGVLCVCGTDDGAVRFIPFSLDL